MNTTFLPEWYFPVQIVHRAQFRRRREVPGWRGIRRIRLDARVVYTSGPFHLSYHEM